jgi:hypothetical protein
MIDLRKTIEAFSELATILFDHCGRVLPTYYVFLNGQWQHVPAPDHPKEIVTLAMRKLLRVSHAEAYVFMDEAWTVAAKEVPNVPPSEHPDRREIVLITAEDAIEQVLAERNILRPAGAKPSLAPLEFKEGFKAVKGHMTGLMPQREGGDSIH